MIKPIPHSHPWLTPADLGAVTSVLRSGQLSPSPAVERFERAAARAVGQTGAVAVSSGTAALYMALRALDIGRGDAVLFPSYVCSALWHAVTAAGATPRLVDLDPATFNLSAAAARRRLTRRTKAIIIPHLFGLPADLDELRALGPPLIEDCAQTLGVRYRGRLVGSFGVATVCSFYATKLVAAGEGGLVASSSPRLLARLRAARSYDEQPRLAPSFNFKLSGLHAALGLSQLRRLTRILALRRRIARRYDRAFAPLPVALPARPADRGHGYYRYVLRVPGGAGPALARMARLGVTARRPVYVPIHRALGRGGFAETDRAWREALSLPLYPGLGNAEIERVIAAFRAAVGRIR
ncbi:MAG: aminotransferase class I/II-fold pyridoxal phosphate-dependent enzyme [Nitrospirota bacterium]